MADLAHFRCDSFLANAIFIRIYIDCYGVLLPLERRREGREDAASFVVHDKSVNYIF